MIEDLPIEIITCILKDFDSNELMSLAYESLPPRVNEALHAKSLWRFKTLHIRNFADYKRCMASLPRVQFCEKVSFSGSQIHRQQMVALLTEMKRIRYLSFEGFLDLCDTALQTVLQRHGAELMVLDLTGCQYLTNFSISQIARRCKKLHTLILDGCSFSSASLEILSESEAIVSSLRHLDISKCYLMDSSVIAPLSKLSQLQVLKLRSHEWLNGANLPFILAPLPQIRLIDIRNCEDFTRSSIEEVKRSLPVAVEVLENTKLIDDSEESIRGYLMALIAAQIKNAFCKSEKIVPLRLILMTTEEEHANAIRVLLRLKNERRTDNTAGIEFFRASLSFFKQRPDCIWCCYADICSEVLQFALLDSGDASLWFRKQTIACLSSCRDCIECYYNSRSTLSVENASFFHAKLRQFDEERLMDIFNRYLVAGKEERKQACFKYAIAEVLVFPGWFGVPSVSVAIERVLEAILTKGKLNYSERPAGIFLATIHRNELVRKWATELIEAQDGEPCETDVPNYSWKTVFFMYAALPVELRVGCLEAFSKQVSKLKLKLEAADYEVFTELVLGELAANSYRLDEYLLAFVALFNLLKPQFDFKKLNGPAFEAILLNPAFSTIMCPAQIAEPAFIEHFLYATFIDNVGDDVRANSILDKFFPRLLESKFKSADFQEYLVKCLTRYLCECLGDSSINYQVLSKLLTLDRVRYRRCIEMAFESLVAHDFCRTGPAKDIKGFDAASEFAPETYQHLLPDLTGINVEAAILRALKIHFRQGKFDFGHIKKRIDVLTLNRPVQDPALGLLLYWLHLTDDLKVCKEKDSLSTAVLWSLNALVYTRFHGFKLDRIVAFLNEGVYYGDCTSWLCQFTFPFFRRSKDFPFAEVAELASIVAQISLAHIKAVEEEFHVYLLAEEDFNASVLESGLTGLLEFIMKRKGGRHFVRLAGKLIVLAAKFKLDLAACKAGQILRVISTSTVIVEEYRDQLVEAVQVYASTPGGNVSFNLASKTKTTAVPKSEIDAEVARRLALFEQLDKEYLERHQDGQQRSGYTAITSKPASKIGQLRQEMARTTTAPVKKRGQIPVVSSSKALKLTGSPDGSSSSEEESLPFSSELFKEPVKSVPVITLAPQRSVKLINSQKEEEPLPAISGKPIQTKAQQLCAMQRKMQRDWLAAHKLHRFILGLDYDTLKEEDTTKLSQKLLQIQQIPSNFTNYDAYASIFEPLLLMESQAQVFQSKEEAEGRATFYPCRIESVQFVDDFHEILFNFGDNAAHRLFTEQDLIVGHENHRAAEGNILGIVTSAASRMTGFEVNVRFFLSSKPGSVAVKLTRLHSHWRFAKLCNLVTASREYLALHNLPLFKSVEWILNPRFHQATSQVQEKMAALSFYCQRNFSLNPSQAQAIAFSLLNENFFSLIQGPPGTGKTRTIEGFLATCLSANKTSCPVRVSARKVLICAPSNAAIDEIVRRIKDGVTDANGRKTVLKIVRVGALDMIHEDVQELSLDVLADTKTEKQFAAELAKHEEQRQQFLALKDKLDHEPDVERSLKTRFHQLKDSFRKGTKVMEETRQKVRAQILREAQVVCCTLSAAGNEIIGRVDGEFEMVIIDEACQAVELSALIPLQYGCKRAVLIGDPNQLPPTIISQAACSFAYEQSLFQRLQRAHPASVQMLSVQYRMHPEISVFPSRFFYNGKLDNGPNVLLQNTRAWHLKPELKLGPYQFFDAPGKESFRNFGNGRQGKSMMNEIEAEMTIDLISKLASENLSYNFVDKIGIITPYKEQKRLITRLLATRFGSPVLQSVEVSTVDGYQGQEKEIIIFSCVRTGGNRGSIGFLNDSRRLNVAITRAKCSLFMVGRMEALKNSKLWGALIADAQERGVFVPYNSSHWTSKVDEKKLANLLPSK